MEIKYVLDEREAKHLMNYQRGCNEMLMASPEDFVYGTVNPKYMAAFRNREGLHPESIDWHIEQIKNGVPLPPAFLTIDILKKQIVDHEGRHRAMACVILGVKEFPVIFYYKAYPEHRAGKSGTGHYVKIDYVWDDIRASGRKVNKLHVIDMYIPQWSGM